MRSRIIGTVRGIAAVAAMAATVTQAQDRSTRPAGDSFIKTAVIGAGDERLQGSYAHQRPLLGRRATTHLNRALRISFPHPGSPTVTGTPVCFQDVVVTAAHIYVNVGHGTVKPMGLRASVPDLSNPGKFRNTVRIKDYMLSTLGRRYDANKVPAVRDDFIALLLDKPLPAEIVPLALRPYADLIDGDAAKLCGGITVNAAYHSDLGLLNDRIVDVTTDPGKGRITAAGAMPLLTFATEFSTKSALGSQFGSWYDDPYVALPEHDPHEVASGSALVCPDTRGSGPPRDYLHGLMIGQLFLPAENTATANDDPPLHPPAINVATINLRGISEAIAALKELPVETVHLQCAGHGPTHSATAPAI